MPWRTKVMEIFQLRHTLVGGTVETIFFPRRQASRLYMFFIQCPIHTKLLISVKAVSMNTSHHQDYVGHFDFGRHFEILSYIILSHLPPTEWTPQTSQSLNILLRLCQWHARKIFILCHTCWPTIKILLHEASSPHNFFIQYPISAKFLRRVEEVSLNRSVVIGHGRDLQALERTLLWCPASYKHIEGQNLAGTFIMPGCTKSPFVQALECPLLWCPASYKHIEGRNLSRRFIMTGCTKSPFGPILSVQ